LQLLKQIGYGSFGEVYVGLWQGTKVAIKRALHVKEEPEVIEEFMSEASLMSTLRHPNIVQFLGATIKPPHLYLVLELCKKGNVKHLLQNKKIEITFRQKLEMAIHTAQGMLYLHSHVPPIVHRDLKTHNLMVDKHGTVKVGDFGLSRVLDRSKSMTYCGTTHVAAPEVIKNLRYSEKADVYSFGICLWEIMTREEPYKGMAPFDIMGKVSTEGMRPPTDLIEPPRLRALIHQCWITDPEIRPFFPEILSELKSIKRTRF